MKKLLTLIRTAILESPGWKTFFAVIIPIFVGVLSGTFVTEITSTSGLDWKMSYKAKSLWGLVLIVVFVYAYYRTLYLHNKDIERFLNDDYCRAYMRSKCLPEAAERYKSLIRNGEGGELAEAMHEIERILK